MKRAHWLLLLVTASGLDARSGRYTLILEEAPLAASAQRAKDAEGRRALADQRGRIESAQSLVVRHLEERKVRVLDSVQTVLNAVFVAAGVEQEGFLASLPGVARVVEMEPLKRHMIRAADLVKAQEGWRNVNGEQNAGAGVRIAVLDSGIDHEHAAFRDPGLAAPAGYPRCRAADCDFTSNKIIVARSYVDLLVLGDNPADSRPDDVSPRDRVGHGTAVAMVAAGVRHQSPLGMVSGIAPRAFLGNYKIFGSPGVNDVTFDNVLIRALEDAVSDGMDIAVLSLGRPALWAPEDRGSTCDLTGNAPCDPRAEAVENASRAGLMVVVSAGNDGDLGVAIEPALNSIHSPGTAPSALTVGASTNGQRYFSSFIVDSGAAPAEIRRARVMFGDGPRPQARFAARVLDLAAIQDDGRACSPIAAGSLAGSMALVQRGDCGFATKVNNAQKAGAAAVLVAQRDGSDFLFPMTGLQETGIPAAMIGSAAAKALQAFLRSNADQPATLDPALSAFAFDADLVAYFSSFGPSISRGAIKPEVAAPGYSIYMATQRFDPNGDMYSPDGYTAAQGTSFAAPVAAGAAALFKQRVRGATPAQVKSAVVNTATADLADFDPDGREIRAPVAGVGAGKVNAADVARTTITAEPAALSFGYIGAQLPSMALRVNNHANAMAALRFEVRAGTTDRSARVVLSTAALNLGAGQSQQITVRLEGTRPLPGLYEGDIVITGGATAIRIPYLYLVGDGAPANAVPLRGFDFSEEVDQQIRIAFKLVDRFGAPVANSPVTWRATLGDGAIRVGFPRTDDLGISDASVIIGPRVGDQAFAAETAGFTIPFQGRARLRPAIATDGVVNAASNQLTGRGVAPGSYAAIYGRNLSDVFKGAATASLPLALAGVSVSFDVPERRLSLAGRLHFVSDGQVNVQVPWELQGLNSATLKVSIGNSSSALYQVPLTDFSPAFFEFTDPGTGRLLIAALNQQFQLVTSGNPAPRGGIAQLYANGLGPVENQPPTGEPSLAQPLATSRVLPTVTVGGRPAEVLFSGLAPGFVGLYQLNLRLAADTPTGVQPVVMTVNGVSSKVANLPIQ